MFKLVAYNGLYWSDEKEHATRQEAYQWYLDLCKSGQWLYGPDGAPLEYQVVDTVACVGYYLNEDTNQWEEVSGAI